MKDGCRYNEKRKIKIFYIKGLREKYILHNNNIREKLCIKMTQKGGAIVFAIKTIENPIFKKCRPIPSDCGFAYIVDANAAQYRKSFSLEEDASVIEQSFACQKNGKGWRGVLSQEVDDEFERQLAFANRIMWE